MNLCLSHWSALQAWRHIRSLGTEATQRALAQQLPTPRTLGFAITPHELTSLKTAYCLDTAHVIVRSQAKRHRRDGVRAHYLEPSKIPQGVSILEPGVYITPPEYVFMHLSGQLSTLGLVLLGCELCSIYALTLSGKLAPEPSVPLTTVAQLENALPIAANQRRAQRALQHVLERSRSPRETEAALKLTLPSSMGGFNQPGIVMNSEVFLSEEGREICKQQRCFPDMLYPDAKLIFEYDGRDYHVNRECEDELRRKALAHDGYRLERITYEQLIDCSAMRELADVAAAARTGRCTRIRSGSWEAKSRELYATLRQSVHVADSPIWRQ